jgi:tetratricopeptide (TPR) repeat protein
MPENTLELGIQAALRGEKDEAAIYLSKVVSEDPSSEEGWLWLGHVLSETDKRKYCYERVLKLNPANKEARQKLIELNEQTVQEAIKKIPLQNDNAGETKGKLEGEELTKTGKFNPILLSVLGVIAGLLLCGLPLFWLNSSGLLTSSSIESSPSLVMPSATVPISSPTQTATATQLSTATVTRSPIPTSTQDVSATKKAGVSLASPLISQAEVMILNSQYAQAIPLLDRAIAYAPDLDEPYYLRAKCYFHLLENSSIFSEFQDYISLGLKDIDQAIALRSDDGNYYALRQSILNELAGNLDYQVDRIAINKLALENARMALDLGTTEDFPDRIYANGLINNDRCEEAKKMLQDMIDRTDPKDTSIGGLYHIQSRAYACLGDLNRAIAMVDKSMLNNMDMEYKKGLKAGYLYQAGRGNEALPILNELIEKNPNYGGIRYYLRAAIYIDRGDRKKAEEDLSTGEGKTWFHGGLYSYVLGQMALADGNTEEAISQFQNAESTLFITDYALRQRIIKKLKQLGALPLEITPSVMLDATPIPTIQPRPTARPLEPTPTLRAGGSNATPIPGFNYPEGAGSAIVVDYEQGLAQKVLQANDFPIFHFQTGETFKVKAVKNIVIKLASFTQTTKPTLQINLYNSTDGGWGMVEPSWGDNPVEFPERYVYPGGDIFIAIRNWGTQPVTIDYLNITLIVETEDGRILILGPR